MIALESVLPSQRGRAQVGEWISTRGRQVGEGEVGVVTTHNVRGDERNKTHLAIEVSMFTKKEMEWER